MRYGFAVRPLLVVVAAKCALNFAFAGRYGWQRDELYYAVAGRHLQGGYVEFPPVTALLSAVARLLFGWSLVGFRAFAILAGAATIVVAALVARELGGRAPCADPRRRRRRFLAAADRDERALPAGLVRPACDDGRSRPAARGVPDLAARRPSLRRLSHRRRD